MSYPLTTEYRAPLVDDKGMLSQAWQRKWSPIVVPQYSDAEVPTGLINGANKVYTLRNAPSPAASLQVFLSGTLKVAGTDYTLSKLTITFGAAPGGGSTLLAWYRY